MKKTGRIGWCSTIPRPWCSGRRRRDETPMSMLWLGWGSLHTDGMQSGPMSSFHSLPSLRVSKWNSLWKLIFCTAAQNHAQRMPQHVWQPVFKVSLKISCISSVAFFFSRYQDASVEASVIAPVLVQLQWNMNWHFWSIIRDLSWSLHWGQGDGRMLCFTSTFRYLLYCFAKYFLLGIGMFSLSFPLALAFL